MKRNSMATGVQRGFTLIEVLIVVTIVAVLASLALPSEQQLRHAGRIPEAISGLSTRARPDGAELPGQPHLRGGHRPVHHRPERDQHHDPGRWSAVHATPPAPRPPAHQLDGRRFHTPSIRPTTRRRSVTGLSYRWNGSWDCWDPRCRRPTLMQRGFRPDRGAGRDHGGGDHAGTRHTGVRRLEAVLQEIRGAGEALISGLQLARAEAVRARRPNRFRHGQQLRLESFGCNARPTAGTCPQVIQSRSAQQGSPNAAPTPTNIAAVNDGSGCTRSTAPVRWDRVGIGCAGCLRDPTAAAWMDISSTTATCALQGGALRCLFRATAGQYGLLRLCDPQRRARRRGHRCARVLTSGSPAADTARVTFGLGTPGRSRGCSCWKA
jgi:prepilin-type N-terminal cleavage/methylation domain-containing protein